MNILFYGVIYHVSHGGNQKDSEMFLFASENEKDDDQIKNHIQKNLTPVNSAITIHSVNKFSKETFVAIGGNPYKRFE